MTPSIPVSELRHLHTVIGRPRPSPGTEIDIYKVGKETWEHFQLFGQQSNIFYIAPNFIIHPGNAHQQANILSLSPLQTPSFKIDLVAWSREHEWVQLPWMTDDKEDSSNIIIDPLAILPLPTKTTTYKGNPIMKDHYLNALGSDYDLRSPDFSYLMINELKEYYNTKHSLIHNCRQTTAEMGTLIRNFYPELHKKVNAFYTVIQLHRTNTNDGNFIYICDFGERMRRVTQATSTHLPEINEVIDLAAQQNDQRLYLENFRQIPTLFQIPVPPTYNACLKTIHAAATKHIHGEQAVISTLQTTQGKYETYITVANQTHRYNEIPFKTPATIETMAIFESLRYMTNVLGYKIVDLNHHTLSLLMSEINRQNKDIILLQTCVSAIMEHTQTQYEAFLHVQNDYNSAIYFQTDVQSIDNCMNELMTYIEQYHTTITALFHQFMDSKMRYVSTYLNTESLVQTPGRWIWTEFPPNPAEATSSVSSNQILS